VFNWLARVIGKVTGTVDETVRRWVSDIAMAIYGFVHGVFHLVGIAWGDMIIMSDFLYVGLVKFVDQAWIKFYHLYKVLLPGIIHYAVYLFHLLVLSVREVIHWAAHEFDLVRHWTAALVEATRVWVVRNVWQPIWRTLTPIFHWITHEGATLWHYLTHPAELVDLLWDHLLAKLEREAWVAGRLLGRFFLSLVVHNVRTFAILVEDIVTAIL